MTIQQPLIYSSKLNIMKLKSGLRDYANQLGNGLGLFSSPQARLGPKLAIKTNIPKQMLLLLVCETMVSMTDSI